METKTTTTAATAPFTGASAVTTLTIEGKQFGRGRTLFPTWQMTLPATAEPLTLREFLHAVVRHEVAAFRERQEQRQTLRALTAAQIEEGVARGKVDAGGRPEADANVDEAAAVKNAIRAFEDGLYYVFVDDTQQENLDAPVALEDGARVTFLRLVALAGG